MSKHAAGKTIDALARLGYLRRDDHPADGRARAVLLTDRGRDCLRRSGEHFDAIRSRWAHQLGPARFAELESGLHNLVPGDSYRLDAPGWFGGS